MLLYITGHVTFCHFTVSLIITFNPLLFYLRVAFPVDFDIQGDKCIKTGDIFSIDNLFILVYIMPLKKVEFIHITFKRVDYSLLYLSFTPQLLIFRKHRTGFQ